MLSDQLSTSITAVLDKINSQQFRISQRLQWAAGANPSLNATVDVFERAMSHRKQLLQEEEEIYQTVYEWSESVIHLESSHTRIPALINTDKEMMALLHRLGGGGRGGVCDVVWSMLVWVCICRYNVRCDGRYIGLCGMRYMYVMWGVRYVM